MAVASRIYGKPDPGAGSPTCTAGQSGAWVSAYDEWQAILERERRGAVLRDARAGRAISVAQSPPYVGLLPRAEVVRLNEEASAIRLGLRPNHGQKQFIVIGAELAWQAPRLPTSSLLPLKRTSSQGNGTNRVVECDESGLSRFIPNLATTPTPWRKGSDASCGLEGAPRQLACRRHGWRSRALPRPRSRDRGNASRGARGPDVQPRTCSAGSYLRSVSLRSSQRRPSRRRCEARFGATLRISLTRASQDE
jgi:hypothetical protein